MIDEITEIKMAELVNQAFIHKFARKIKDDDRFLGKELINVEATSGSFQEIKIQLLALGIIVKGDRRRPPSDSNVYWRLTKYGERLVMSSMAKKRFALDIHDQDEIDEGGVKVD